MQPSLAQSEDEAGTGAWAPCRTGSPASQMPLHPPTHSLGPDSLGQAMGYGQHPLGSNKGASTDVDAISPHTDHPWPPPSHGFWVSESRVCLMGGAAD